MQKYRIQLTDNWSKTIYLFATLCIKWARAGNGDNREIVRDSHDHNKREIWSRVAVRAVGARGRGRVAPPRFWKISKPYLKRGEGQIIQITFLLPPHGFSDLPTALHSHYENYATKSDDGIYNGGPQG